MKSEATFGSLETAIEGGVDGCQVVDAFTFGKHVYALCEIRGEDDTAAAVVEITLGATISCRPLIEMHQYTLNYHAHSPTRHWAIDGSGRVFVLDDGELTILPPPIEKDKGELSGIAAVSPTSVALLGERGLVYRLEKGVFTQMPTGGTQERMLYAHFLRPDLGYAVGNYGTLMTTRGDGSFTPVDLPAGAFSAGTGIQGSEQKHQIVVVHAKADGTLLLGTDEGPAYVYQKGELLHLQDLPDEGETTVRGITEFRGVEYWGSTDYGILVRDGNKLVPKFPTGGCDRLNATDEALTLVAGQYIYVWDGKDWTELMLNPDVDNLIERIDLDFDPAKP